MLYLMGDAVCNLLAMHKNLSVYACRLAITNGKYFIFNVNLTLKVNVNKNTASMA